MLRFKRRYYRNTLTNEYLYLLDAAMKIPKRDKIMYDVKLKILETVSEMSYAKAGRYGCANGLPISKSTVCRLIEKTQYYIKDNMGVVKNDATVHV